MEYLRTASKALEGSRNKNDLLGWQSTEMMDELIDTKEASDIFFVGKQICAMLVTPARCPLLIKKIAIEGSTIAHIKNFDPSSLTI